MPMAKLNGINLYYESSGTGTPVVFIPGLGGTTDLWRYQTDVFKNVFHTISLDNRGAGRSDTPLGLYSMRRFAQDIDDLLDYLAVDEPVILVGASMGGIIAQAFIHDYPKRVKKLVLACTCVSLADSHITLPSSYVRNKLANPGATAMQKIDTFLEVFYHAEFVAAHPELKESFFKLNTSPQPAYAYFAQLAACADPRPYYRWLQEIAVPVLVIHGRDDMVWPVQNATTLMSALGVNGELAIIEKAAHMLMQEKPAEFNRLLEAFINRQ